MIINWNITPNFVADFKTFAENSRYYFSLFLYQRQSYSLILNKQKNMLTIINGFKEGVLYTPIFCTEKAIYAICKAKELRITIILYL